MIDPNLIYNNIEEFEIYPSHKEIFITILDNIETEKKIIIAGEMLGGKSFFGKKLSVAIGNKLKIKEDKIFICDLGLILFKKMIEEDIQNVNANKINEFVEKNNLNVLLNISDYNIIVLDEINDIIFNELLKFKYEINSKQILIQIVENRLFLRNKFILNEMNYKSYQLVFPKISEIKEMIGHYNSLACNDSIVKYEDLTYAQYKKLII